MRRQLDNVSFAVHQHASQSLSRATIVSIRGQSGASDVVHEEFQITAEQVRASTYDSAHRGFALQGKSDPKRWPK
ncbi:UNVERIFIED_ORG: hypothetical protein ABIC54_006062 [Burkholderia sp. 1263]